MLILIALILAIISIYITYKPVKLSLSKILILGVLLRLLIIYLSRNTTNFDIRSFTEAGALILQNKKLYPEFAIVHNPYFPFFVYLEIAAHFFKPIISSATALKLFILLFETLNIYFIFKLSKKSYKVALLYSLNPITIYIASFQGQMDAIPIFFLLVSIYLFLKNKQLLSVIGYALAILAKTWPVLFIIPYLRKIKPKYLLLLIPVTLFINILIYQLVFKESMLAILETVKSYRGLFGYWGIGSLYRLFFHNIDPASTRFLRIIFFGALFVFSILVSKQKLIKATYLLLLFFYSFTFALAVQYLAWIVPFLLIIKQQKALPLFMAILTYQLLVYSSWIYSETIMTPDSWEKIITISGLILWLYIIGFWWQETKQIVKA